MKYIKKGAKVEMPGVEPGSKYAGYKPLRAQLTAIATEVALSLDFVRQPSSPKRTDVSQGRGIGVDAQHPDLCVGCDPLSG